MIRAPSKVTVQLRKVTDMNATTHNDAPGSKPVESIKEGEYVKRKADSSVVFVRGAYIASEKRYELMYAEDMCRCVLVKKGTPLFVGFTY
jgi:hypothetical protein